LTVISYRLVKGLVHLSPACWSSRQPPSAAPWPGFIWANRPPSAALIKSILPRLGRYLWLMTITAFYICAPLLLLLARDRG
jgi:hypothetical protein